MTIVVLTNCPQKLRGDMTKWFIEINTGVYIGKTSARVRKELWERICKNLKNGQATMVFPAAGEQHFDFLVHNTTWKPRDYDGIKLMLRPEYYAGTQEDSCVNTKLKPGFSKAAKIKRYGRSEHLHKKAEDESYVVLDFETTGLNPNKDCIIEIGAVRIENGALSAEFSKLIAIECSLPKEIVKLTGITDDMLRLEGEPLKSVMKELCTFIGSSCIVCHHAPFDLSFFNAALISNGIRMPQVEWRDTCLIAKKKLRKAPNYRLETLLEVFQIDTPVSHRALADAHVTQLLYEKLKEI